MKRREGISPTVLVRNSLTTPREWTLKVHLKGHPEDVLCECCFPRELSSRRGTCSIIWPFPEKDNPPPQSLSNRSQVTGMHIEAEDSLPPPMAVTLQGRFYNTDLRYKPW